MFKDTLLTTDGGRNIASAISPTRQEQAWLSSRLDRGRRERFSEIVRLTPGLASLALEHNSNNRCMTQATVDGYARTMVEGRWRLSVQGLSFAKDGRLIDGQHRCAAVERSATTVPMTVWFGAEPEEFAVIDTGRRRDGSALLSIDGLTHTKLRASLAAIDIRQRDRVFTFPDAAKIWARAIDMQSAALDEAIQASIDAYKVIGPTPGALSYLRIIEGTAFRDRLPVFWRGLITGADLPTSSPILRVRDWLRGDGRKIAHGVARTSRHAAAVIIAWNAFVSKRTVKRFEWDEGGALDLPEVI